MPFLALAAGAAGFYLRLLGLDVFDKLTGLPKRGEPITFALIALSIVFILVFIIFSIIVFVKHSASSGFENAFGTDPLSYPLVFTLIGVAWLGATVKYYLDLGTLWPIPVVDLIFIVLSAFSAISIALFSIEMYQDPRRKSKFTLSVVPSLFMCLWLVVLYRRNAANPVLLSYCYECLAIITATLGFYFTSGFVYNKPAPGKSLVSYFAAIYFCFVTLADPHTLAVKIIFASLIAINVVHSSMLIKNLQLKEN